MSVLEFTTDQAEILKIPLVDLANPAYLRPLLAFIARTATPCVAEGLMHQLTTSLMHLIGCARAVAISMLHRMIQDYV